MADGPAGSGRLIGELRVATGPSAGKIFMVRGEAVIGRDDAADIVLADTSGELSRRHARITTADGNPVVEDLGSTNGTFVNDERLLGRHALHSGDQIRVGASTLEFTAAEEPRAEAQVTRARAIPSPDVTRARRIPDPAPPPDLEPTFAPAGADGQVRILSGPGAGATAPILGGSVTIGREPECELQVLDSEVSRRHAKVTVRDGVAAISDLRSSNGTYVGGERILGTHTLAPGDRIQIGEATIELTTPVFEGVSAHVPAPQVAGVRDALAASGKLLGAETGNRKWWTLAVVCITVFMLLLDVTIVGVALPSISADLKPSFTSLQWIIDGYTLGLTAVLLTAGSFADIFGRKRVLTIGLGVFTAASVLCAQAPNATFLDVARGIQGLGGATMFACSLSLIVQEFPAGERPMAFGIYGAVNGLSVAMGPIVGGLLVEGIGWEAIFYLNVPIALGCFVMLRFKVVNVPGPRTRIDWGGLVTSSLAMFLTVFATIRGNEEGWTSATTLGCYAGALVLFVLFVIIQRRVKDPMLDLALFRNPTFVGSSVSAFTSCFSVLALIFFLTVWMQSILGYSAIETGLRMLVLTGACLLVGPLAGRLTGTVNPRITLTLSLAIITVATAWMMVVDGNSAWTAILPGLVLAGIGLGLINPTLSSTAVSVVPPWRSGMASGMSSTAREAGTTFGIAVMGMLLQQEIGDKVHSSLKGTGLASKAESIADTIAVGGTQQLLSTTPKTMRADLLDTAQLSYASGLRAVFLVACAMALIGAVTSFALVRRSHLRDDATAAPGH